MPFATLKLLPGVNLERTETLNTTQLAKSNLIRFYNGLVQKLGGWQQLTSQLFIGTCRQLHGWADIVGNAYLAIGTEQRLEVLRGGAIFDITPIVQTDNPAVAFSTVIGTPDVTITDAGYSPDVGDWLYLATHVSVGGIVLFGYYLVASVVDGTHFTVTAASNATATITDGGAVADYTTASGFATINVQLNDHGLVASDTYTAGVSTTVGGLTINGDYGVSSVVNANNFVITAASTASGTASASENGGNARIEYLLPSGLVVNTRTSGYGSGFYGGGFYGGPNGSSGIQYLRQWSLDNWGADLIASPSGGAIYFWQPPTPSPAVQVDAASGTASFATNVMTVLTVDSGFFGLNQVITAAGVASGTTIVSFGTGNGGTGTYNLSTTPGTIGAEDVAALGEAPTKNLFVFVMPQVQIIIAGGAETGGTLEPLLVRWCDAGDFTDWTPTAANQAGSYQIPTGSRLVGGLAVGLGALLWTDIDLWTMTYEGLPFVFGFNRVSTACGLIAQRAAGTLGTTVMWLSTRGFFHYTPGGGVTALECPVWDFLINNLDLTQFEQITCANNALFNELAWHFPIAPTSPIYSADAPYAYVKVNLVEAGPAWDYGQSSQYQRTAWTGQSPIGNPVGADPAHLLQQHEVGYDANGSGMIWSWQTGDFSLAEGEIFAFVDMIVPDNITVGNPTIDYTVNVRRYPNDDPTVVTTITATPTTQFLPLRARGRQMSIAATGSDLGTFNRLGALRYRFAGDGRQ